MRTGDSYAKSFDNGYLYRALSSDSAMSWSVADRIAPMGVDPNAVRMQPSGIIAVAFGRPANYLSFSLDSGRSFRGPWCFDQQSVPIWNASCVGCARTPYDGQGYDGIAQVPGRDDELILIYARSTTSCRRSGVSPMRVGSFWRRPAR